MDQKTAKQRLQFYFAEIEKEFDALLDENAELKKRIAALESGQNKQLPVDSPNNNARKPNKPLKQQTPVEKGSSLFDKKNPQVESTRPIISPLFKNDIWVSTREFSGHRDGVWEVTACPWSLKRIGSASADRTARIWAVTLEESSVSHVLYVNHTGSVNSIRFHPRERLACTASGDKTIHIWKVPSSKKEKELAEKAKSSTKSAKPLRNSSVIHAEADLFDNSDHENFAGEGDEIKPKEDIEPVDAENQLVEYITIKQPQLVLSGHGAPVLAADWLNSGNSVASVSWDNSVILWDSEEGKSIYAAQHIHEEGHAFTNLTTKDNLVTTSSSDGVVRIWDSRTSKSPIYTILAHEGSANSACLLGNDDNMLISAGDDRACKTWDIRNQKQPLHTIRNSAPINRFSVSPISSSVALPMDDKRTKLCDISGNRLGNLRSHDKGGHTAMITSTAWSNDESVVYTSSFSYGGSVVAWTKEIKVEKKKPHS